MSVDIAAAALAASPWDLLMAHLNATKIFAGCASMMFNLGSRMVIGELTPMQQQIFQHPVMKRLVIFCMFFVITRDVAVSAGMALVSVVALEALFHERSRFCVIPGARGTASASSVATAMSAGAPVTAVSKHVVTALVSQQQRLQQRQMLQQQQQQQLEALTPT